MRKEYIGVIDKEIDHHKDIYLKTQNLSDDYKDGFIAGMEQVRSLLVQVRAAELHPETSTFTDLRPGT